MDKPSTPQVERKARIWIGIMAAVLVIVVIVAAIAIVDSGLLNKGKNSTVAPKFVFISTGQLKSIYGYNFTSLNYTKNFSLGQSSPITGDIVKEGMWIYSENSSTTSVGINALADAILELNNSTDVVKTVNFFRTSFQLEGNVTLVANSSYRIFLYLEYGLNVGQSNITLFIAHYNNYVLLMEFIGSSTAKSMSAFQTQVNDMI